MSITITRLEDTFKVVYPTKIESGGLQYDVKVSSTIEELVSGIIKQHGDRFKLNKEYSTHMLFSVTRGAGDYYSSHCIEELAYAFDDDTMTAEMFVWGSGQ